MARGKRLIFGDYNTGFEWGKSPNFNPHEHSFFEPTERESRIERRDFSAPYTSGFGFTNPTFGYYREPQKIGKQTFPNANTTGVPGLDPNAIKKGPQIESKTLQQKYDAIKKQAQEQNKSTLDIVADTINKINLQAQESLGNSPPPPRKP